MSMGTWTKMKVKDQVHFSVNLPKTHVTATSIYGTDTQSVADLKIKVKNPNLHPTLRKIYRDMLEYAEKA